MKRIKLLLIAAFLISGLSVYSQKVEPGNVVGITQVKPAEGVSTDQFEKLYLEEVNPAFNKAFSLPMSLMKTIKGKRMNEYAEFYVFESVKEWKRWFPKPGVPSDEFKKARDRVSETWSKYRESVTGLEYTDYLVLPFSGKSVDVKQDNVVIVSEGEYTLEEGMTFEELEQFFEKEYGPAVRKNFPGMQYCILKGDRGDRTGKYTEFVVFESKEEYSKWFGEDGKLQQALDNMREIQDRWAGMRSYNKSNTYIVL